MIAAKYSLVPPPMAELLVALSALSDESFSRLLNLTRKPNGFDISDDRSAEVARRVGLSPSIVSYLIPLLTVLYQRLQDADVSDNEIEEAVSPFVESLFKFEDDDAGDKKALVQRLSDLLRASEEARTSLKNLRLKNGFLNNATGFSTLVDIRPNFDENRASIVSQVAVVQFCINTDADNSAEKRIVFQVDEPTLRLLKEAVEDTERKLRLATKTYLRMNVKSSIT